jgi:hypothetical protein
MVAAYRDSISAVASGSTISVDPSTLTYSANDVLLLHVFGYGTLGTPSGSDLTWTQILSDSQVGEFGNTDSHKVFWAIADASITSFTVSNGIADQHGYFLTSISGADTTTPVDGTPGISSETHATVNQPTAPSVTTTGTDSLLVCAAGVWPASDTASSFTAPGGMTEREDIESWDSYTLATEALSASGATGTRAFTESPALSGTQVWIASSVAIKSAGGGGTSHTHTQTDSAGSTDGQSIVATAPITWSYGVRMGT